MFHVLLSVVVEQTELRAAIERRRSAEEDEGLPHSPNDHSLTVTVVDFPVSPFSVFLFCWLHFEKKGIQRRHAEASADAKLNLPLWNTYVPLLQKYCWNKKSDEHNTLFFKKKREEIEKSIELLPQSLDGVDGATFGSFFRWFPESLPLFGLEIGPWNTNVGHRTRRLPRLQRVLLGFELEFTGFLSGLNWLLPSTLVRCVFPGCSDFFSGICRVPLDLVGLVFFSTFAAYYRVLIGVCNRGNRTDNTKPVPGKEQQQGSVSGKQRKKWHQAKGIGRDKENQKSQAGGKNE